MKASPATISLGRLLVATDGSDSGNRAVSYALTIARVYGSELLVCYALDRVGALAECSATNGGIDLALLLQTIEDAANAIVNQAAQRANDAGISVTTTVLDGPAAQAIVTCAHDRAVDAIVIGTQDKRGIERLLLGSTAQDVIRRADVPVVVVPPTAATDAAFDRILVAADDSDAGDAAAVLAISLAEAGQSRLVFCGVAETTDLLEKAASYDYDPTPMSDEIRAPVAALLALQAESAAGSGVGYETVLAEGHPVRALLKTARAQRVGLIIVGTHGRRGMRRLVLGSVAEGVIHGSSVPVVVVRAPDSRTSRRTTEAAQTADVVRQT